ncbi:MAG: DNA-directed RNA polymerase subunit H [Nanoarchaeota archaeon]
MVKKIDITQHALVPKFSKLSEEETKQVLNNFNISLLQLPTMSASDVMSKAVDAKPNDIIKIVRVSKLGKSPYFRRVIE